MELLPVSVWSDIACPWCWIGKRHLEAAAARSRIALEVTWRAFELDPRAPRSGGDSAPAVDYVERLARKYRVPGGAARAMIDRMVEAGAERGLEFRFDRIRPGNTFDGHRLLALGRERGVQDALSERLFAAYFRDGRAIDDPAVLAECGADVGLEAAEIDEVLASDAYSDEVRDDERRAAELGVTGVPFFVVGERHGVPGAQPPEVMRQVLERAATEVCGPEGCRLPDPQA